MGAPTYMHTGCRGKGEVRSPLELDQAGVTHCCQHKKEEEMQMCLWAESTHIHSSPELPAVAVPMKQTVPDLALRNTHCNETLLAAELQKLLSFYAGNALPSILHL